MKAFVVAGVASGVGKTTVAAGLMGALRRRGLRVQAFKIGPDYIDPMYHARATGRPARNLDSWLLPAPTLRVLFARAVADADVAVVEGVMGLYDGRHGGGDAGSTAEVARLLDLPVVLVLDASRQGRSAAATVLGFRALDPRLRLIGVVLNRVGSAAHAATLRAAVETLAGLPVLGVLHRRDALAVPERYLGLVPPAEQDAVERFLDAAATLVGEAVDLGRLLRLAERPEPAGCPTALAALLPPSHATAGEAPGSGAEARARLAVARDRAFGFYYADALDLLAAAGLELCEFSPLAEPALPPDTHGLYLGGGFPELFAADLAANRPLLAAIRAAAARGLPIYAECGGLMYLAEQLVDRAGRAHALVGVVPATVTMHDARLHLGYRTARALRDTLLVPAGGEVRGHEFHYSAVQYAPTAPHAYRFAETARQEGYAHGAVLASYLHLHLASAPALAARFAAACARWRAQSTAAGLAS